MPTILSFVFRLFLLAAGLVFAASLAVVFVIVLALWLLRAGWARLTGRPVMPFVMRMHPRNGFAMYRRAGAASRTPRADAAPLGRVGDVTDVEPKQRF
ncbi:hypothetical protein FN976_04270 [Caenimonas sedimenti]|uniref:Uncharacterized protein n=1 Tax=Caenimonas sedimenti TaxID=2596921 RepID=A0A562ZWA4_9BURK|nr:hypothetical protein [Caenimonas sedimenti]TWO72753.1 hypothetical protein FN976_04270 [Caenimonas sedimenti]